MAVDNQISDTCTSGIDGGVSRIARNKKEGVADMYVDKLCAAGCDGSNSSSSSDKAVCKGATGQLDGWALERALGSSNRRVLHRMGGGGGIGSLTEERSLSIQTMANFAGD